MRGRIFVLTVVVALGAAGCATTQQQTQLSELQMKVYDLEKELQARDETMQTLQDDLNDLQDQVASQSKVSRDSIAQSLSPIPSSKYKEGTIRVSVAPTRVQEALKAAQYYDGPIDGKIGERTIKAIKAYQKDAGIEVDGVVGRRTWEGLTAFGKR